MTSGRRPVDGSRPGAPVTRSRRAEPLGSAGSEPIRGGRRHTSKRSVANRPARPPRPMAATRTVPTGRQRSGLRYEHDADQVGAEDHAVDRAEDAGPRPRWSWSPCLKNMPASSRGPGPGLGDRHGAAQGAGVMSITKRWSIQDRPGGSSGSRGQSGHRRPAEPELPASGRLLLGSLATDGAVGGVDRVEDLARRGSATAEVEGVPAGPADVGHDARVLRGTGAATRRPRRGWPRT